MDEYQILMACRREWPPDASPDTVRLLEASVKKAIDLALRHGRAEKKPEKPKDEKPKDAADGPAKG